MQRVAKREQIALFLGCGFAFAFIVFSVVAHYTYTSGPTRTAYENVQKRLQVLEQMHIHVLKSVDMEKSAVMALTDHNALEYAKQSRAAAAIVDQNITTFRSLVDGMALPNEKHLLETFTTCWTELGKIDQVILQLAGENSNFKAAVLSQDKGGEDLQRFEHALNSLRLFVKGSPQEGQIAPLIADALVSALKLFNIHGPHILEADETRMDQLEERMKAEELVVTQSLAAIGNLLDGERPETFTQANNAFSDFTAVTTQVVQLSRKNSNIKSLMLSSSRKQSIAAQCDASLAALQQEVQSSLLKPRK